MLLLACALSADRFSYFQVTPTTCLSVSIHSPARSRGEGTNLDVLSCRGSRSSYSFSGYAEHNPPSKKKTTALPYTRDLRFAAVYGPGTPISTIPLPYRRVRLPSSPRCRLTGCVCYACCFVDDKRKPENSLLNGAKIPAPECNGSESLLKPAILRRTERGITLYIYNALMSCNQPLFVTESCRGRS